MDRINVIRKVWDAIQGSQDLKGAIDGITDEIVSVFRDKEITIADSLARGLDHCKPMSDRVDELSLSVMHKAIKQLNYKLAKDAIRSGTKERAKKICIKLLVTTAITACDRCPDILLDALPQAACKTLLGFGKK